MRTKQAVRRILRRLNQNLPYSQGFDKGVRTPPGLLILTVAP